MSEYKPDLWHARTATRPALANTDITGLPIEPVFYGPITEDDLQPGRPWPPDRLKPRATRMDEQLRAARGDMTPWADSYSVRVPCVWFGDLRNTVRALLMQNEPEGHETLQAAASGALRDLMQHGAAFIANTPTGSTAVHAARMYPHVDGSWIAVNQFVDNDPDNPLGDVNRLEIIRFTDVITVEVREFRTKTSLGPVVQVDFDGQLADRVEQGPVDLRVGMLEDDDGTGWGTPWLHGLIPIMVEASMAYTDIRYSLRLAARPKLKLELDADDAVASTGTTYRPSNAEEFPDAEAVAADMQRVGDIDVWVSRFKGAKLTWLGAPVGMNDAAQQSLENAMMSWDRATGTQAATSDNAAVVINSQSTDGQFNLLARCRQLHSIVLDLLPDGTTWDWPIDATEDIEQEAPDAQPEIPQD